MEIIAEIFIQLFGWVFELLGELLLQAFGELIAELIGRSITEPFRRPKPVHPVLATLGYAIFGALAGGISLWLLPSLFIAAGADLKSVQSLLGHQSSRTTHDTYGHLLSADHLNSAVRRLDTMIGDEMGTSDPDSEPT